MFVRPMSDIHLEFGKFKVPVLPTDSETVLVLAGDINVGLAARNWITEMAPRFLAIVYVLGNHEFYKNDTLDIESRWENAEMPPNVYVLINGICQINEVNFIGSTLWSDFNNLDYFEVSACKMQLNDYRVIRQAGQKFTPNMAYERCLVNKTFLHNALLDAVGKTVVVTHHIPSRKLISMRFALEKTNGAYAARCDHLIDMCDLWVYGHTHDSLDMQPDRARIVCNPRGYLGHELNPNFNPTLLVEI